MAYLSMRAITAAKQANVHRLMVVFQSLHLFGHW